MKMKMFIKLFYILLSLSVLASDYCLFYTILAQLTPSLFKFIATTIETINSLAFILSYKVSVYITVVSCDSF